MTPLIKVLIVDDSSFMRETIKASLSADPSIEIIGEASNGRDGIRKALSLNPNVITMDLKMPIMTGIDAIENIMENNPIPIIVVSSCEDDVIKKALDIGAMDFVTPSMGIKELTRDLIEKIKIASRVRPFRRRKFKKEILNNNQSAPTIFEQKNDTKKIIVIGVSTGGPQALQEVFRGIPKEFSGGIAVVQHISKGFIHGLVEWLKGISNIEMRVAKEGDKIENGTALFAPDNANMLIGRDGRIILKEDTTKSMLHVPAIDELMKSASNSFGSNTIGIIMTGMGQDGVEGIKTIKNNGGFTLAQDKESSIIYGMNRVAIEKGYINKIVSLYDIAEELVNITRK
ncbi:response regulator receiver modulated CheB methylesterase [Candidatus Omnitrophus magneticus]|uniref:Protein-glutamate methylesterase/protein-glutamine glutaminase n=1 Tax=Candidatus Omnitrophus magneticus TaxID=1609969 RepID=A0A0F0CUY6_9BACT|nr:response regulator receiver modulated CheB methylesterase [Candidatus Omnitrophus magneticus]